AYVAGLVGLGAANLIGVDLAETDVRGLRTIVADVRDLPFPTGAFGVVLCISTLEHVGLDNTVYGLVAERSGDGQRAALRELRRVLAGNGRLLVTVPCGESQDLDWQVQLPPLEWVSLFEAAGFV